MYGLIKNFMNLLYFTDVVTKLLKDQKMSDVTVNFFGKSGKHQKMSDVTGNFFDKS